VNQQLSFRKTNLIGAALLLFPALAHAWNPGDDAERAIGQGPIGDRNILASSAYPEPGTASSTDSSAATTSSDAIPTASSGWQLSLDLCWVDPSGTGISTSAGDTLTYANFNSGFGAGVRVEYQFSNRYGFEIGVLGTANVDVSLGTGGRSGRSHVGVTSFAPVTLGLNVHLTPDRPVDVFVGPLLALSSYGNVDVSTGAGAATTPVSIDNDIGFGAVLGLDLALGDSGWLVQTNVRYFATEAKSSAGSTSFSGSFNPVIFSLGLGYRF